MKKLFYIGAISALLLAACGEEETKPKEEKPVTAQSKEKEEKKEKEQKEEKKETSTLTIDQYENTFKNSINEIKDDSTIEVGEMEQLENGRYSAKVNFNIFLFVDVDKKDNVTNVSIAAPSDSFDFSKRELEIAFQALLKSIDVNLSSTQQTVIFEKLGITFNTDMLDRKKTYKFNDIMFFYQASIEKGNIILQAKLD